MIRLGIVDCDTSHVVQFTSRFNHLEISEDQWVDGAQVVMAFPGTSRITDQETIDDYTAKIAAMGVELVAKPEEMIGKIDGVLIESQEGGAHLQRARPFLEAGVPCFIDKPFACSIADAWGIADLAARANVPVFSSSSLRYALEIQELQQEDLGRVLGSSAYGPALLDPYNPGLFHYGIHAVETLYAFMGPGCREVRCVFTEGAEITTGTWKDGKLGSVRGTREGSYGFGFVTWYEKAIRQSTIDFRYIYRELLKQIIRMFETGKAPVDIAETMEIVAFQEAALKSAQSGGEKISLAL